MPITLAAATVVLDPDPLPELAPSATPTIPVVSPSGLPTPRAPVHAARRKPGFDAGPAR